MRKKTKRTIFALLSALLISLTAFGLSGAFAETAGNWTGTVTGGGSAAEAYLTPKYEVGFAQGFTLNQSQEVSIVVSPHSSEAADYRAVLTVTDKPSYGDVLNTQHGAKGLSISYRQMENGSNVRIAGFGTGTWSTKTPCIQSDGEWTGLVLTPGTKYTFGLKWSEGAYWLTFNGSLIGDSTGANLLAQFEEQFISWITDDAEVYFGFGSCQPVMYDIYSVTEGNKVYTAQELSAMETVGPNSFVGTNLSTEYVEFASPVGIDIALDATQEITVHAQGDIGWANIAFLTECSNAGFAANGSTGTGFSVMTNAYGGLKLDFMKMENGIKTPEVFNYFSAGAPGDVGNKDGITVPDAGDFQFTIKPVDGGFEFWLQGVKMTDGNGNSLYDAIKDKIGSFVNANDKTYLNVSVNGTAKGKIYSIQNGSRYYSASEIAAAMNSAPKTLFTNSAQVATGEGSYSGGLPVLDFAVDFAVESFATGNKTLTFSDGDSVGTTVTLGFADAGLTAAVGDGAAVNVGVGAGEYVRAALLLENGKAYLTMNGTRIGEVDPIAMADDSGKTYLSFGGTNTDASLFFYSVREQELRSLKSAVTVNFASGTGEAEVSLLNAEEEEISCDEFIKDGTYYLYTAKDAAPASIRVSAAGYATQTVNFAATAEITLETLAYDGTVTLTANGNAVSGATVTLKQGEDTLTMTESATAGTYTISNLRGAYTITVEKAGYEFPSATISDENAVAIAAVSWPYEGSVTVTANGKPVSGATVTLTKGAETVNMTEGEGGVYTAENLSGTYTVTVEKEGLVFETQTISFANGTVSAAAKTFEGIVTVKVGTVGISGATVTVSETGIGVTDNGDGTYTIGAFAGSYTVTVTKDGYAFGNAVTLSNGSATAEVTGTYSATVTVKLDGEPLEGVTVVFSGASVVTATYANGAYTASGLTGEYTVTATKDGYTIASGSVSATSRSINLRAVKDTTGEEEKPEDKKGCASIGLGGWAGLGGMCALLILPFAFKRRKKA